MTAYFDNAATTMVCKEAADASYKAMTECYGNPSSGHSCGRAAAALLRDARESIASALGANPEEVYFTSGGTEGDNWAILGAAYQMRHRGHHIITSAIEHDAVRKTMQKLETEGWEVTFLSPDKSGIISAEAVLGALREDTSIVSIMLVNNEIGTINPIGEIAKFVKRKCPNAIVHTDAVQAFLKIPFTVKSLGADIVTISSHKIHGPKGAGALYIRKGVRIGSILTGGGQEGGFRPGTEPMPAIAGFGAAAKIGKEHFRENTEHMKALKEQMKEQLTSAIPSVSFIGDSEAPHILNISLVGYRSEVLMNVLDSAGISVSKSSACRKGARSHVLEAMKLPAQVIDGAIRISFSRYNTSDEVEYFVKTLADAASRLRTKK
jgi:cysteine desulfurase